MKIKTKTIAKACSKSKKDKFIRCSRKLLSRGEGKKSYPICRKSTGYKGTSRNIGLLKPITRSKKRK